MVASARELVLPGGDGPIDLEGGSILFIGNATVLVCFAGLTILTDPTFIHMHGEVPLGYGLKTRRLTNPALDIKDLPPLDLIVLSHFHGDHFDQVAEAELDRSLPIVTVEAAARELAGRGFENTYALDTWSAVTVRKGDVRLTITATPGRHGPPLAELVLPDVMGSIWEYRASDEAVLFRMYVTGDTLVIDDLKELPRRYPDIDLALLHLGGTRVLGVLVTMDARQGVEMLRIVEPRCAIPIHYNDYDVFKSPLADFQREVEAAGLQERVRYLSHGETHEFKASSGRGEA